MPMAAISNAEEASAKFVPIEFLNAKILDGIGKIYNSICACQLSPPSRSLSLSLALNLRISIVFAAQTLFHGSGIIL